MQNVISKIIKTSPSEVLMEETHIKRTYETKYDEIVFHAQISQVHPQSQYNLLK